MGSELDLAGTWEIHHDPLSQGTTGGWNISHPKDGWVEIEVPSAWQSVLGIEANGLSWYRRDLPREAQQWANEGARVRLRFESVATDCWVFVNGRDVGRHVGDYLPFELDITDAVLKSGARPQLTVRVDQMHAPRPGKGVVIENGHITKGFHDVLSLQHAGIWGGVSLRRTGSVTIVPAGLHVDSDPATGIVNVRAEITGTSAVKAQCTIRDPSGSILAAVPMVAEGHLLFVQVPLEPPFKHWSPATPVLYSAEVQIAERTPDGTEIEEVITRTFGFRTIQTGGPENSQILLNGSPIQIRGLLHWGHEPRTIAPMPSQEQVREEFREMLARGFNCICLCMFYPPDYYFDIADEMGVLVWQEHPVWKSRMTPECMPEYKRCYEGFFKRDRQHPSVIIVSGTCEHDTYDKELGKWWWQRSGEMLPRTLRQIQTGFLEWTPPEQTDLYDDHVYDNCGRWVAFHEDMQDRILRLPLKPFVMGETIISNAWPDVEALSALGPQWWVTHGLKECGEYERAITRRIDSDTAERFKRQGQKFGLEHRKYQAEVLRMHPRIAGFVTNSIRDVPICRLGLIDDLDHWRFSAKEMRPWLSEAVLLLRTPQGIRGFRGGQKVKCEIGISNFSSKTIDDSITIRFPRAAADIKISVKPGEIAWRECVIDFEAVDKPEIFSMTAVCGEIANTWLLTVLPEKAVLSNAIIADVDKKFTEKELAPTFEEKAYSSGWGLPCESWKPRRQIPHESLPTVLHTHNLSQGKVVITSRLTREIDELLHKGGRVILYAGPHAGGIDSKWINTWGVLPLIVESDAPHAIIRRGESDALLPILMQDLLAYTCRALPTDDLGLADHLDPVIRLAWTHDSGIPKSFDVVSEARVGSGLLLITTADHTLEAGQWLLERMVKYAAETELKSPERELDISKFLIG